MALLSIRRIRALSVRHGMGQRAKSARSLFFVVTNRTNLAEKPEQSIEMEEGGQVSANRVERVHCINQSVFSIRLLLNWYIKLKSETEMVK